MEEIFPISGLNTPDEKYTDPFDTVSVNSTGSVYSDPFDLEDDEQRITAYDIQRLRGLVASFARGFDVESFPNHVEEWVPRLQQDLFPGSYAHLMALLLEDWDQMEHVQISMLKSLREMHPVPPFYDATVSHVDDDFLFASELDVLKKLLAPLRGDDSRPIYWVGTRIENPDDSCIQMKNTMRIIKNFKEEILSEIQGPNDDRTIYSPWNGSLQDHKAEVSVREFRMDACKASLGWGEFLKTDLHFTSFHQYYKSNLIETAPERARAVGFLPPLQPGIPKYVPAHPDTDPTAWCNWQQKELRGGILDLILKTAVWLGLARGAAAAHLFCDVVRAFSLKPPTEATDCDRIALLYHFTSLRVSCDGIESGITTPFSHDDHAFADKNTDYFTDVESPTRSENHLEANSVMDSAFMDYFNSTTQNSEKLPLIHRRSRISQGQIKTYHDREVLDILSQAPTEMTLSSKTAPEKPPLAIQLSLEKLTIVKGEEVEGKEHSPPIPASRPIPILKQRSAPVTRFVYF